MSIAILGTGAMAKGLATRLSSAGYSVVLGSREPDKASAIAKQTGRGVQAASIRGAASAADVVLLAVPYSAALETLAAAGDISGKVLIDITNPMKPDFSGLTVGHTTSAAEEIQKAAPGASVVKALNTIFAHLIARRGKERLTTFYAGDDARANEQVRTILEWAGFRAEYAGPLKNARYLEPIGALNITFGYALGAGLDIAPEWRRLSPAVAKAAKAKKSERRALVYRLMDNP